MPPPPRHVPPPPEAKRITAEFAARHVRTKHHADCTRQTIHNWMKHGVRGEKLKGKRVGYRWFTTKEWVDEFIAHLAQFRAF
jgi:hypothetical protein